jgi:hypothetical protein
LHRRCCSAVPFDVRSLEERRGSNSNRFKLERPELTQNPRSQTIAHVCSQALPAALSYSEAAHAGSRNPRVIRRRRNGTGGKRAQDCRCRSARRAASGARLARSGPVA